MTVTRVYLVDDNDGFRDSTAWLLETAGFEVESFASGAAFLEAYAGHRHGDASECLVSDIRMPEMSGLQLQDELGRLNDHVTAEALLASSLSKGDAGIAHGWLAGRQLLLLETLPAAIETWLVQKAPWQH